MKSTNLRYALLVGLSMALPLGVSAVAAAHAGGDAGGAHACRGHFRGMMNPARLMQRFDKNGNGVLELAELPGRMQQHLAKADANGDGALSADELKAFGDARKQEMFRHADKNGDGALEPDEVGNRAWERLRVADADGNGGVTLAEIEQARANGTLRGFGGHGRRMGFKHLDKNGDGVVDLATEVPDALRQKIGAADADHDGKLTKDELVAFRRSHRFAHLDKNGDGVVTRDEVGEKIWSHLGAADRDGDGKITPAELEQLRSSRR